MIVYFILYRQKPKLMENTEEKPRKEKKPGFLQCIFKKWLELKKPKICSQTQNNKKKSYIQKTYL